jgi:hypothetical protein
LEGTQQQPQMPQGESPVLVFILYLIAFLFFFIGIIIGIFYLMSNDPNKKALGRNIIVVAIIGAIFYLVCYFFWWATVWAWL